MGMNWLQTSTVDSVSHVSPVHVTWIFAANWIHLSMYCNFALGKSNYLPVVTFCSCQVMFLSLWFSPWCLSFNFVCGTLMSQSSPEIWTEIYQGQNIEECQQIISVKNRTSLSVPLPLGQCIFPTFLNTILWWDVFQVWPQFFFLFFFLLSGSWWMFETPSWKWCYHLNKWTYKPSENQRNIQRWSCDDIKTTGLLEK